MKHFNLTLEEWNYTALLTMLMVNILDGNILTSVLCAIVIAHSWLTAEYKGAMNIMARHVIRTDLIVISLKKQLEQLEQTK